MFPAGIAGIETRHVALGSGVRIRVLAAGPVDGFPVLLLHGWSACVYSFAEMLPALANAGFHAITFDFPGFGLSDKPLDPLNYTADAFADVALELAGILGFRRYSIVGHSMGGSIALDMLRRQANSVERAVLIGAVGLGRVPGMTLLKLLSPPVIDRVTPAILTRTLVDAILRVAYATPGRPTARDVDEYWAPSQFDEYALACRASLHGGHWRHLPDSELRSLRVPVLAILGGHDYFVRGAADRARLIPEARVVRIEDGGHLVLQECAPRVNAEVVSFLQSPRIG